MRGGVRAGACAGAGACVALAVMRMRTKRICTHRRGPAHEQLLEVYAVIAWVAHTQKKSTRITTAQSSVQPCCVCFLAVLLHLCCRQRKHPPRAVKHWR